VSSFLSEQYTKEYYGISYTNMPFNIVISINSVEKSIHQF